MILHILMYNVISDFSAATPASEGRVKDVVCWGCGEKGHLLGIVLIGMGTCKIMGLMTLMHMQERVNRLLE